MQVPELRVLQASEMEVKDGEWQDGTPKRLSDVFSTTRLPVLLGKICGQTSKHGRRDGAEKKPIRRQPRKQIFKKEHFNPQIVLSSEV